MKTDSNVVVLEVFIVLMIVSTMIMIYVTIMAMMVRGGGGVPEQNSLRTCFTLVLSSTLHFIVAIIIVIVLVTYRHIHDPDHG